MVGFSVFLVVLFLVILVLFFMSKPFLNPYRLYMVFGKKGSGKTTLMTKLSVQYYKKGWSVFSNCHIPCATEIDVRLLGTFVPPPNSVLLLDEVGMIWDNRHYKDFPDAVRDYFKLQRHYNNVVYLFSQTFDIDIKLRTLTDVMYLVTAPLPFLSVARRIKRRIVLVQPGPDSEGRIADSLEFVPWILSLFGARSVIITWIPHWAKFFDSFAVPNMPVFNSTPLVPDCVERHNPVLNFFVRLLSRIRLSKHKGQV